MRVLALLATFNEERFIIPCLEHLVSHGVEVYLIDNESEDRTVELARSFLGRGLAGIETFPRRGVFPWQRILERKEQLAFSLEADWFMHVDADEIRLPPAPGQTLKDAFAEADHQGFNAVNFLEFTFVPTRESPDHDHPDYLRTMRWYYPFLPTFPNQLKAWKKQAEPVELAWAGGHLVRFPELRMYPVCFPMRHYLFLSKAHAMRKYVRKTYDPEELSRGWHRARAGLRAEDIALQEEAELRHYVSDALLDPSSPLQRHPLFSGRQPQAGG
ncbi:MAG TPA: glycosyltransferase family 2 protein [Thermoanaerobaculia bacterium]